MISERGKTAAYRAAMTETCERRETHISLENFEPEEGKERGTNGGDEDEKRFEDEDVLSAEEERDATRKG